CQLPGRRRGPAALFRASRYGAPGHLGDEEAWRAARAEPQGASLRGRPRRGGRDTRGLPRRAYGRPDLRGPMSGNEAAPPVPDAAAPSGLDGRVVFLAATARDGTMTSAMLAAEGVDVAVCRTFPDLLREARAGAGALLMPEEASSPAHNEAMRRFLAEQPPWSDIPVLVLTRPGADSVESSEVMATFGNVTLLERPVRVATLLSAIRTALRARERQYQLRRHLAERALAEESLRLADQRKDEFLATLGHELRNPLAPLQTALHLLKASDLRDPLAPRL